MERKYFNYIVKEDGTIISPNGNVKKTSINPSGYHVVSLYYNRSVHSTTVHRLVAELYVPLPYGADYSDCYVTHIDGNKNNNHYKNLKWETRLSMGSTVFKNKAVKVEVTYPDGTSKVYDSMGKAAKAEIVSMLTVMRHANNNTTDSKGRTWKRL